MSIRKFSTPSPGPGLISQPTVVRHPLFPLLIIPVTAHRRMLNVALRVFLWLSWTYVWDVRHSSLPGPTPALSRHPQLSNPRKHAVVCIRHTVSGYGLRKLNARFLGINSSWYFQLQISGADGHRRGWVEFWRSVMAKWSTHSRPDASLHRVTNKPVCMTDSTSKFTSCL